MTKEPKNGLLKLDIQWLRETNTTVRLEKFGDKDSDYCLYNSLDDVMEYALELDDKIVIEKILDGYDIPSDNLTLQERISYYLLNV